MIDINKQYRTKNGFAVRIYATDGMGLYPVHGAMFISLDHRDNWSGHNIKGWSFECWTPDGRHYQGNEDFDLIEVKPRIKRTFWFNIVSETQGATIGCLSKEHADRLQAPNRIACVKVEIDCEEGEGLDQ
jgi:hypothetical protein